MRKATHGAGSTSDGVTISGTGKDDYVQGTDAAEVLNGRGGEDLLSGNGGADTYSGGDGFDMFWNRTGDGVDVVADYQLGETLILGHGQMTSGHHYLTDGETWTTSTGETFRAYEDSSGATHLEFTDASGQVGGLVLEHTDITSVYTGWFSWSQVQPDVAGYSMFGGLSAF